MFTRTARRPTSRTKEPRPASILSFTESTREPFTRTPPCWILREASVDETASPASAMRNRDSDLAQVGLDQFPAREPRLESGSGPFGLRQTVKIRDDLPGQFDLCLFGMERPGRDLSLTFLDLGL